MSSNNQRKNNTVIDGHSSGKLNNSLKNISAKISMTATMLYFLITVPAMPLIFYLTILYNVMIMVMEFFRDL